MTTNEIINQILGIVGLIATILGSYLTYISFVNPLIRFRKFLNKPNNWEKFIGIEPSIYYYRYRKYPNFQIVIDWNNAVVEGFKEEWTDKAHFPDSDNNASYFVQLKANGMLLDKELFVSLDGHRYFVPVPRTMMFEEERIFYYDSRQIQLANIIGEYYRDNDILEFASRVGISINMSL